jgi:hypothetical protein
LRLEKIHSFLLHPGKGVDEQPAISGTEVPGQGGLYRMLNDLYARAPEECNIELTFRPNQNGAQHNACADLLLSYVAAPSLETGRPIAERLQRVTTKRSGLGLLFLLKGVTNQNLHTFVVSRFPADEGVVARENQQRLSVEFVEQVFMKNSRAYKSALFHTESFEIPFSEGRAVDRQMSDAGEIREYWISDFLDSQLRTTGAAGTRRLATALQGAVRSAGPVAVKHELVCAAGLMRGQAGRVVSAEDVVQQLGLSKEATEALIAAFPRRETFAERFRFDADEFEKYAHYRALELNNGALLMAEDAKFDRVFTREDLDREGYFRYITEGRVVDERLRKIK